MHRETVLPPSASTELLRDQGASCVSLRRAPKIMKVLHCHGIATYAGILLRSHLNPILRQILHIRMQRSNANCSRQIVVPGKSAMVPSHLCSTQVKLGKDRAGMGACFEIEGARENSRGILRLVFALSSYGILDMSLPFFIAAASCYKALHDAPYGVALSSRSRLSLPSPSALSILSRIHMRLRDSIVFRLGFQDETLL